MLFVLFKVSIDTSFGLTVLCSPLIRAAVGFLILRFII